MLRSPRKQLIFAVIQILSNDYFPHIVIFSFHASFISRFDAADKGKDFDKVIKDVKKEKEE